MEIQRRILGSCCCKQNVLLCVSGSAAFKELRPTEQKKQKLKLRLHPQSSNTSTTFPNVKEEFTNMTLTL